MILPRRLKTSPLPPAPIFERIS